MTTQRSPGSSDPGKLLITHRIVVRFSDCDPLGHVNNARYLTYLEEARIELWRRQAGLELRDAVHRDVRSPGSADVRSPGSLDPGLGFILARMEIDFLAPAHDGDVLEVRLTLDAMGRKSMTFGYEMVDETTGQAVASARSVVVWYDYSANQSIALSDEKKALFSKPVPSTMTT